MEESIKYKAKLFDDIVNQNETFKTYIDNLDHIYNKYKQPIDNHYQIIYNLLYDSCKLIDEIINYDLDLYRVSLDNYNNPALFLPSYHLEHINWKLVIIWERLFNFIGIIYSVDFSDNCEKNNICYIYDKLKKIDGYKKSKISKLLKQIYGNNTFYKMNIIRKQNDHNLSYHYS